jgi:hypothetical protein
MIHCRLCDDPRPTTGRLCHHEKDGGRGYRRRPYFYIPGQVDLESMVIKVKGGQERKRGRCEEPSRHSGARSGGNGWPYRHGRSWRPQNQNFHREMGEAGDFDVGGVKYSRMQMLTVREILSGKRFMTPTVAKARMVAQPSLPLGR